MKNRLLQLVAAVPELVVGDVGFNTERILEMIRENADSALIVFPELSVTGYTCADLFLSDLLLQESERTTPTSIYLDGDDVYYTDDGEAYFRCADAAEGVIEYLAQQ